jgi:hypothetical protein
MGPVFRAPGADKPGSRSGRDVTLAPVRAMFLIYLVGALLGIAYFTVIGLSQH